MPDGRKKTTPLIIGSRGSELALWQANYVRGLLSDVGLESEIKIIKTQGDKIQDLSLEKLEGKGFFTKEIEDALIAGETDIAVHSHKDLPTTSHQDLVIGAVSLREDPSELLLIRKECTDKHRKFYLKHKAVVGTSSSRRKSQLLAYRSDLVLKDIRGNVPTRLKKLADGEFDAILLAAAGIERLELDISGFHAEKLNCTEFIPAPAQGVLAIQVRKNDKELLSKISAIDNTDVRNTTGIERRILQLFQGGCHMPLGAYAEYDDERELYSVRVCKSDSWDKPPVSVFSESADPAMLAERAFQKINSINPASVFITRHVNEGSYLKNVLQSNEFTIHGFPLIDIIPIPFANVPDSQWVFFSSKHSVRYFFSQKPDVNGKKFACVGKPTSEELRKHGHRADFIGGSTDTRMTGKQFAAKVGNEKVLFPQAKGSLRAIQQQFVKREQVIDLVVYESVKGEVSSIPDTDMLVFTSPSNVEAFFEKKKVAPSQIVIAMGDATANALRNYRVTRSGQCDSFDEAGLARAIFSASSANTEK